MSPGSFIVFASAASSRKACRRMASASSLDLVTGLFFTGSNGEPQSRCLTKICLSRKLSASFLAFLAGGAPAGLSSFGTKCTTTAVHCALAVLGDSAALAAISPLMARGLPRNSVPTVIHSSGFTAPATGADTSRRNWCRSAHDSSVTLVSGEARSSFVAPGTPPSGPFQARSPRERDTAETAPLGLLTKVAPPSALKTTPPFSVKNFCSLSRWHRPWLAPIEMGTYLSL
mmetsp:Transcript_80418/g.232283  ORF Transcript_80418/g.232283 Transcript_80418/m.232283 type:complete len:230 (+) Transcript_80418:247-936(+)